MNFQNCINQQCRGQHIRSLPSDLTAEFSWEIQHDCLSRRCKQRWFTCNGSCLVGLDSNSHKYSSYYLTLKQRRRHHNVCHSFQTCAPISLNPYICIVSNGVDIPDKDINDPFLDSQVHNNDTSMDFNGPVVFDDDNGLVNIADKILYLNQTY